MNKCQCFVREYQGAQKQGKRRRRSGEESPSWRLGLLEAGGAKAVNIVLWLQEQPVQLKSTGISYSSTVCKALLGIKSKKVGAQDGSLVSRFQGRYCLRIQTTLRTMMMSEDRHTQRTPSTWWPKGS